MVSIKYILVLTVCISLITCQVKLDNSTDTNQNLGNQTDNQNSTNPENSNNNSTNPENSNNNSTNNSTKKQEDSLFGTAKEFNVGLVSAFSALLISEFGDKTFFIAAILAIRNSKLLIFNAAMLAYLLIGFLSCAFGKYSTKILPTEIIRWIAMGLFFFFSLQMFWVVYHNDNKENFGEMQEVEEELGEKKPKEKTENPVNDNYELSDINNMSQQVILNQQVDPENNDKQEQLLQSTQKQEATTLSVFGKCFSMIFFAEWGDKSQITQVAMSASYNAVAVYIGSMLAMAMITLVAVFTGKLLAQRVSERTIQFVAAFVFLAFAINMLLENLNVY